MKKSISNRSTSISYKENLKHSRLGQNVLHEPSRISLFSFTVIFYFWRLSVTISIPKYYAIQNDFRRFFEIPLEYTFIRYEVCIKMVCFDHPIYSANINDTHRNYNKCTHERTFERLTCLNNGSGLFHKIKPMN